MASMSPCTVLKGRLPTYAVYGGSVGSSFCLRGPPGPPGPRGLSRSITGQQAVHFQVLKVYALSDTKLQMFPVQMWFYFQVINNRPQIK